MRIAVTGTAGQVARSLQEQASKHAGLEIIAIGRPRLDLSRPETVLPALDEVAPDLIVNAAAYTAVDKAEAEPDRAFAVNRDGAAAVAHAAAVRSVPIIQLSTDYVFKGDKPAPYVETDPVDPATAYGRSKLAGENAVRAATADHIIVRTAWVYAPFGHNFVATMLRLARERTELRVVDDQIGCPTYAPDLADALLHVAGTISERGGWDRDFAGTYHLAGADAMTWCAFARRIFAVSQRHGGPSAAVIAVASADYPTPALRPRNSRLDSSKFAARFGMRLPGVAPALEDCMPRLLRG